MTTDDIKNIPHFVIWRTNGQVKRVVEFSDAQTAHSAAVDAVGQAGEIIVACKIRTLESFAHRHRAEGN